MATVNQFNAVSFRVISTVLVDADTRPSERAQALAVWIDIAQVNIGDVLIKYVNETIFFGFCYSGALCFPPKILGSLAK